VTGGLHDVRLLHDCRVPMADGVMLSADVYLPCARGPFPTVCQWTPYESTRERFVAWGVFFARRGYAAVVVDVRGRYESGGDFYPWRDDGRDAHDTLTWAVEQSWCNARVGTWGRSYGALVQWQLLHVGHSNLECVAPQVIHDDYFWDGYWTGGAFQLGLTLGAAVLWNTALSLVTGESAGDVLLGDRVLRHLPLVELDEVAIGRRLDYWRDWWAHQENDDFWQAFRHRPERVTVPIFQQGGWFDPYSGSHLRTFEAVGDRVPSRLMIGPWSHEEEVETFAGDVDFGRASVTVIREHELAFYDRYLRDEDNGWDDRPPLELFLMGANEWVGLEEWPPPGTLLDRWYLRSGGRLDRDAPRSDEPPDRYDYDPADPVPTVGGVNSLLTMTRHARTPVVPGALDQRALERRDDVLCYTSESLERDVTVMGPVEALLYAASSGRDTDFFVRLCDVHPDGRSIVLTEGVLRARYHGSEAGERTELLEPDEVAEYRIRLYPTANVFRAGHRMRVDVTSSSFPRFARNLNTGEDVATGTRMQVARQTVLHTDTYPSQVLLPVIER
jgi:putative CocE/NonD family hydrolase